MIASPFERKPPDFNTEAENIRQWKGRVMNRFKFRYQHLVGLCFLILGLAFEARPAAGALGYVTETFGVSPWLIIHAFMICGLMMLLLPMTPARMTLLTFPLLLISIAGALRAKDDPSASFGGSFGYFIPWVLILYHVWEQARTGGNGFH